MIRLRKTFLTLLFLIVLSSQSATHARVTGPLLTIKINEKSYHFTAEQLLKSQYLVSVTAYDENVKMVTTFQAIPFCMLLKDVPGALGKTNSFATIAALDGHISHIPMQLLLGKAPHQSVAYLDIDNPAKPWPKGKGKNLGPFRLQWTQPQKSHINESYWIYQIATITIGDSPAQRFPAIHPSHVFPDNSNIMKGFRVFQRACFACHTLNGAGDSHLGPDLNIPFNPIEYLGPDKLAAYIRDPQSLRLWSQARMQPIGKDIVSDQELENLIAYLTYMTSQKVRGLSNKKAP